MSEAIGQELGNKLSVKSFGWDKEHILEAVMANKDADHFLARFGGVATGLRKYKIPEGQRKEADDDSGFGLSGVFNGTGNDGEVKKGSILYLPKYVHEMVEAALSLGDDVAGVRIGFDIYARYDKASATSYVFVARDLLNEPSASLDSVMEALNQLPMPSQPKALAAPKK
jgi:hypothetical protein